MRHDEQPAVFLRQSVMFHCRLLLLCYRRLNNNNLRTLPRNFFDRFPLLDEVRVLMMNFWLSYTYVIFSCVLFMKTLIEIIALLIGRPIRG